MDQPRLQPNPVKDRFRITGIPAIREVRIYSAAGALVHRERWTAQPDVSGLSTGSYIAEVETPDGRLHRWRFVKE